MAGEIRDGIASIEQFTLGANADPLTVDAAVFYASE